MTVPAPPTASLSRSSLLPRLGAWLLRKSGDALAHRGHRLLAAACYRQARELDPQNAEAAYRLGRSLLLEGSLEEATGYFRAAIAARPSHAEAHNNLGVALERQGRQQEAEACYRRALELNPRLAPAHNNLGNSALAAGRLQAAETHYRQAIRLDPDYPEAHNNLGGLLNRLARHAEAEAACRRAWVLFPEFAGAANNLGNALWGLGKVEEAAAAFEEALRLEPGLGEAWVNLAILTGDATKLAGAVDYYEKILARDPRSVEAHVRLGLALQAQRRLEEAETHFLHALEIEPGHAFARASLGHNRMFEGRLEAGLADYRRAIELDPENGPHSSHFFYSHYAHGFDPARVFEAHRAWGQRVMRLAGPPRRNHPNPADPERRLKLGYVSADFCRHSVTWFFEPLLRHHDRSRFEIHCYSNLVKGDEVTERIRAQADGWRDVRLKSDADLAARIEADGIDILVDLNGHTSGHRLGAFARKPAPIQASYLGYPDTTGVPAIDTRITDAVADPPGWTEAGHVERLTRLPGCFLAYQPPADAPAVAPLPCLATGRVTFGSFNNALKTNPRVAALWARILDRVPGSRLLLKHTAFGNPRGREHFARMFGEHGVGPERLDLRDFTASTESHLALYGEVDVALDPFPYNGTTTTCEALWMGVPVVALAGRVHVGRVGVSLLSAAGLADWVAAGEEEYLAQAVALAADPEGLARIRAALRPRLAASPLLDGAGLARRLERAYRQMWHDWCETAGKQRKEAGAAT